MKTSTLLITLLVVAIIVMWSGIIDYGLPFGYYLPYPLGFQGSPAQKLGLPYIKL